MKRIIDQVLYDTEDADEIWVSHIGDQGTETLYKGRGDGAIFVHEKRKVSKFSAEGMEESVDEAIEPLEDEKKIAEWLEAAGCHSEEAYEQAGLTLRMA